MKTGLFYVVTALIFLFVGCSLKEKTPSQEAIMIPMGGNTYLISGQGKITKDGLKDWADESALYRLYFRITKPGKTDLFLKYRSESQSEIKVKCYSSEFNVSLPKDTGRIVFVGSVMLKDTGYVHIDFQGVMKTGTHYADISDLIIDGEITSDKVDYVGDFSFYWGRRGPSVHLNYPFPENETIEWFYNEITVPEGEDPVGTYYMANGFGEGYFGIQVNSPTERRVLFSVWSPFSTDNPQEIPDDQKIKLIKKGENVYTGEFGNEGAGGQSYLIYPWITGNTYSFLTRIHPDGNGSTEYTSYFYAPEKGEWMLIAQFLRPKTDTYYKRAHSFLESFNPELGYKSRKAFYNNQWAYTIDGQWIELTTARFTADETARKKARMDYKGGAGENGFFLQNCGFLSDYVTIGTIFSRNPTAKQPLIEWNKLK